MSTAGGKKNSNTHVISVFNNKGGVGKTTLTYHLGHALAELGKKTLFVDLDPQCNLTIYNLTMDAIDALWSKEDPFFETGFDSAVQGMSKDDYDDLLRETRSAHFLLGPTEEGTGELSRLPPPANVARNLDLIPGRLTLHMYEDRISSRWSDLYRGDPLAIRTATRIRSFIDEYATKYDYEVVLVDTSPSLGALNKVIISTVDSFMIPCLPDVFSLYGIRNIGKALRDWTEQYRVIQGLLSREKRRAFPAKPVSFLGFTIFNARKYTGATKWDLAQAHYNYAKRIPKTIASCIPESVLGGMTQPTLSQPIGETSVMHSHNTLPSMANKYRLPIWRIPDCPDLEPEDRGTIAGNRQRYLDTKTAYTKFANAVVERLGQVQREPQKDD